jgi:hypothetical protein
MAENDFLFVQGYLFVDSMIIFIDPEMSEKTESMTGSFCLIEINLRGFPYDDAGITDQLFTKGFTLSTVYSKYQISRWCLFLRLDEKNSRPDPFPQARKDTKGNEEWREEDGLSNEIMLIEGVCTPWGDRVWGMGYGLFNWRD